VLIDLRRFAERAGATGWCTIERAHTAAQQIKPLS
jgi:hypothetical protein